MNKKVCPTSNRHIVWFIFFPTDMSVRGDTFWLIYSSIFPIFKIYNKIFSSLHYISFIFCAIVLQVEFVGVLRSVPLRRNEIHSSWETIVHYPRYKLRGQIRLKDTTLSLGSDLLSNYCLHYRFVSFIFFVLFLNEHEELQYTHKPSHS